jgi:hypothetical protein
MLFFCVALVSLRAGGPTVTAVILSTGRINARINPGIELGTPGFVVETKIENQSTDSYVVVYPCCSWDECWTVQPRDDFHILSWDCAKNFLVKDALRQGDGVIFKFTIVANRKDTIIEGRKIKLGFIEAFGMPNSPIIWSKELVVPESSDQLSYVQPEIKGIRKHTVTRGVQPISLKAQAAGH